MTTSSKKVHVVVYASVFLILRYLGKLFVPDDCHQSTAMPVSISFFESNFYSRQVFEFLPQSYFIVLLCKIFARMTIDEWV